MSNLRAFRPKVERLADRIAPAVFEVTNTGEGPGSLREAIAAAERTSQPDTIVLAVQQPPSQGINVIITPTIVGDTSLGAAAFRVSTPITIDSGDTALYFDIYRGGTSSRFATVTPTGSLTLRNVRLGGWEARGQSGGGGGAGLGGAILNQGVLSLIGGQLGGNSASGGGGFSSSSRGGGGLAASGTSTAGGGPNGGEGRQLDGGFGGGGGPGADAVAEGDVGRPGGDGGFGGGGGDGGRGGPNSDNNAGTGGAGGEGGFGGGGGWGGYIPGYPERYGPPGKGGFGGGDGNTYSGGAGMGGAVINLGGSVVINRTRFVNNQTTSGSGSYGGAIFNLNGTVVLSDPLFEGNIVRFVAEAGEADGGDIFNLSLNASPEVRARPARVINLSPPGGTASPLDLVNRGVDGPATVSTSFDDLPLGDLDFTPTSPLDAGRVSVPYSTRLAVRGGGGVFQAANDRLPLGLTLASDGTLSGTPTNIGVYSFSVEALGVSRDGQVVRDSQLFTMLVGPKTADIQADGPLAAVVGRQFRPVTFTAVVDPPIPDRTFPISFKGGTLPPGMAFGSDGRLTGNATAEGTFTFTLSFTSDLPLVGAEREFTLTVGPPGTRLPTDPTLEDIIPIGPTLIGGRPDGIVTFDTFPETGILPFGDNPTVVRVARGRVTEDEIGLGLIAATGPGTPLRVVVFYGPASITPQTRPLVAPFAPFAGSEGFAGGGFVSAGDFDGDGIDEFVVTPDRSGGPRVSIFSIVDGQAVLRANFFGIDDRKFRGGARTAVGDINGDRVPDLVVAAGFGGGPRVAVFDGLTLFDAEPQHLVGDFFAFEPKLRNGTFVTVGDIDADGFGDVVFGAGPGGGPRVSVLSGAIFSGQGTDAALAAPLADFFSGSTSNRGGVRVAIRNADNDGRADLVTGSGAGQRPRVREYPGAAIEAAPGAPVPTKDFDPFAGASQAVIPEVPIFAELFRNYQPLDGGILEDGVYVG